jgi:hypothetical protein
MSVKTHLGDEYLTGVGRYSSEKSQSKKRVKSVKKKCFKEIASKMNMTILRIG